ncbi:MAG TPA: hypothetical protein PLF81_21025 [Candidatus Anammoximicrobium sp.]|nr:hypothetical protein [Candidatus Anammoximicrobium sp.]
MQLVTRPAIIGVVLACLAANAAAADTNAEVFFRPARDLAGTSDPDKLFPQGRTFPVGFYGLNLGRDRPEGLTLIGPYGREQNVDAAKKYGLKCTYTISLPMEFHSSEPLVLSRDEIRQRIREQVEAVAGCAEIAWWYLAPEELRYWRKNEIAYLEVAADAIRQADPQKRPVWMYDPGHRDAAGLAHTVKHLDICGKGMYTNYSGQRENRVWVRWTIEQEIKAIEQAIRSAIPIAVPEMFQQPPEERLPMIRRWVRHDVYLSLMTGAKGIMVFSGWRRPKFAAFDRYYEAYAECIQELNGPLQLGQIFLFGERRNDIRVRVVRGPSHVTTAHKEPVEFPSVAVLDVALGKHRYLFLANSSNESVRIEVQGLPTAAIAARNLFGAGDPQIVQTGQWEPDLEPLEVKAFRLEPAEQG